MNETFLSRTVVFDNYNHKIFRILILCSVRTSFSVDCAEIFLGRQQSQGLQCVKRVRDAVLCEKLRCRLLSKFRLLFMRRNVNSRNVKIILRKKNHFNNCKNYMRDEKDVPTIEFYLLFLFFVAKHTCQLILYLLFYQKKKKNHFSRYLINSNSLISMVCWQTTNFNG